MSLWVKSWRRRACRPDSLARPVMVRRSRREYFPPLCFLAQVSWRALRRSSPSLRAFSPDVSDLAISRGAASSETYAEHATPKSTPQPGSPFGGAEATPVCTPKLMCQVPEPSTVTVAFRTWPAARDHRNRTQPILGSRPPRPPAVQCCTGMAQPAHGTDQPGAQLLDALLVRDARGSTSCRRPGRGGGRPAGRTAPGGRRARAVRRGPGSGGRSGHRTAASRGADGRRTSAVPGQGSTAPGRCAPIG